MWKTGTISVGGVRTNHRLLALGSNSHDQHPLGCDVGDIAWPRKFQGQIAMEVPHLPVGRVLLEQLLGEGGRKGMLSTEGTSAVMSDTVGCEMHAQQQVRLLVHRLVRPMTGPFERVLCTFTQAYVSAPTDTTPRGPPREATCRVISRGHCHPHLESVHCHAARAAAGVRHAQGVPDHRWGRMQNGRCSKTA